MLIFSIISHIFLLGRPAFSIDSLLQRKVVVHGKQLNKTNQNEDTKSTEKETICIPSTIDRKPHLLSPVPACTSSAPVNPLESLTFENILKSAAIQQQRGRGKHIMS